MKKILLIAAIAVMLCSCGKKNSYTITGNVTGLEGTVTLMNDAGDDIAEAPFRLPPTNRRSPCSATTTSLWQ